MRRYKLFVIALAALVASSVCIAGGTVSTTKKSWTSVNKITVAWSINTNSAVVGTVQGFDGELLRYTIPGADSTNIYSFTLTDADGVDMLQGAAAALSNIITSSVANYSSSDLPFAHSGDLTLAVTNAALGASGSTNGTLVLYYR